MTAARSPRRCPVTAAGPMLGAGVWHEVIRAAGSQCECAGQCGRSHQRHGGRCPHAGLPGYPLHAVPREPAGPVAAMRLGPDGLMALCGPCGEGLARARLRDGRQAAGRALRDASAAPLFEVTS